MLYPAVLTVLVLSLFASFSVSSPVKIAEAEPEPTAKATLEHDPFKMMAYRRLGMKPMFSDRADCGPLCNPSNINLGK